MYLKNNEHKLQKEICRLLLGYRVFFIETDIMDGLKFCHSESERLSFINHHKSMGYKKGQSDLIILLPNEPIFVELKNGKDGRQSDSQKIFQANVESLGFKYKIWRSLEDCLSFLQKNIKEIKKL